MKKTLFLTALLILSISTAFISCQKELGPDLPGQDADTTTTSLTQLGGWAVTIYTEENGIIVSDTLTDFYLLDIDSSNKTITIKDSIRNQLTAIYRYNNNWKILSSRTYDSSGVLSQVDSFKRDFTGRVTDYYRSFDDVNYNIHLVASRQNLQDSFRVTFKPVGTAPDYYFSEEIITLRTVDTNAISGVSKLPPDPSDPFSPVSLQFSQTYNGSQIAKINTRQTNNNNSYYTNDYTYQWYSNITSDVIVHRLEKLLSGNDAEITGILDLNTLYSIWPDCILNNGYIKTISKSSATYNESGVITDSENSPDYRNNAIINNTEGELVEVWEKRLLLSPPSTAKSVFHFRFYYY